MRSLRVVIFSSQINLELDDALPIDFEVEWWSENSYEDRAEHLLSIEPGGENDGPIVPGYHHLDDNANDIIYGEGDEDLFMIDVEDGDSIVDWAIGEYVLDV